MASRITRVAVNYLGRGRLSAPFDAGFFRTPVAAPGDRDLAGKTFSQAFDAAAGVGDREGHFGNASNACYAHIIRAMAEVGREKDAAEWAAEQRPALLKAQALVAVVEGVESRREAEKRGPRVI